MKKFVSLLVLLIAGCPSLLTFQFAASAKSALLVTHYGSSDDSTRALTIDRITADMKKSFPGLTVREAYISPVVRKNLAAKGISVDSPEKALLNLAAEGYDSVFVQSTTIIEGFEMDEVRKDVEKLKPFFDLLSVGNSLLASPDDCRRLVEILAGCEMAPREAVIYVGHGNYLSSTATYTQLDYMLTDKGFNDIHVSTIEGFPDVQATLRELRKNKYLRKVRLIPLLLVCGNHTKNDIAMDFAGELREARYEVDVIFQGLAENPAIRALYVEKACALIGGGAVTTNNHCR